MSTFAIIGSDIVIGLTTPGFNTTGADLIVLIVGSGGGVPSGTPSDSKGNTWTALTGYGGGGGIKAYYCKSPSVGAAHTFSHNDGAFSSIAVIAVSGADVSTGPYDKQVGAASNTPGSVTPTYANSIIITGIHNDQTGDMTAISGGFTLSQHAPRSGNRDGVAIGYLIQTSIAAANPAWTVAGAAGGTSSTNIVFFPIAPPGCLISAAATCAMDLRGSGAMASAVSGVGSAALALKGAGALALAGSGISSVSVDLRGAGKLAIAAATTCSVAADLRGTGSMTASMAALGSVVANLIGSGSLLIAAQGSGAVAANLVGSGALAASIAALGAVSADLRGSGALLLAASGAGSVTAALNGSGALTMTVLGQATVTCAIHRILRYLPVIVFERADTLVTEQGVTVMERAFTIVNEE